MERITPKEVTSMMQAVAQVYEKPEVEQEVISKETQQVDEGIADDPRSGVLGQAERLRRKMFGTPSERNQAVSYERSIDALTKSRGGGNVRYGEDGKPITADQIAAETKRRRLADPKYKPGQGVDSGAKPGSGGTPQVQQPQVQQPQQRPQSPSSNLKPGSPNETKDGTKFERRLPTSAELRAAQQARKDAPKVLSRGEIENRAIKAGVGVSKGTVKDPKIAADANRKAELERIRQRAALQTRAGVRPTVASTADSQSRTAAGMMSNKSASGSGPGGYQLPAGVRPLTYGNAAATPVTPAATGAGSVAQRVQAVRTARMNPRNRNTQLNQGDPMERMTGKGAASLMETYSKVYEEREPQAIDEGIMGALAKVGNVVAEEKTAADPGMKARMGKEEPKKGGYQLPKRTPANAKNVEYYKDDVDLFDVIKGHFIEEGLTEEEALAKMIDLTDEERTEIIEGLGSLIRAGASAIRNRMQSGTVRTPNINLPRGGGAGAGGRPTSAPAKPRGEDIFTSTPPGGKPYGNKKKLPAPGTQAAKNAPLRDEPLF